jgi:hypothetical protein
VFTRYAPAKIRYEGDRPVALLGVRIAPSYRLVDLPLGSPTTSARSERGTWALHPLGAEVVVVHPDGAVTGPPADVAAEIGRLAAQERQGELDRQAAQTIRQLLAGDGSGEASHVVGTQRASERRRPRARARHAFPQHHHRSIHRLRRITEASQGGKPRRQAKEARRHEDHSNLQQLPA